MGEPETTGHGRASIIDAINAEYESEYGEKLIQDNGEVAGKNFRYSAKRFDVSGEDSSPNGVVTNGQTLIVSGQSSVGLFQYSFGTDWDISTLSYDNIAFDTSGEDTLPGAMISNGETLIIFGEFSETMYQYKFGINWDLSTLSYDGVSATNDGFGMASDGEYVLGSDPNQNIIRQYSMDPWDLSTLGSTESQLNPVEISGNNQAPAALSSDGSVVVFADSDDDDLFQYSLGADWDLDSATYDGAKYTGNELEDNHTSIDGLTAGDSRLIAVDAADAYLHSYSYHDRFQIPEP
jgi:hypothetical protein